VLRASIDGGVLDEHGQTVRAGQINNFVATDSRRRFNAVNPNFGSNRRWIFSPQWGGKPRLITPAGVGTANQRYKFSTEKVLRELGSLVGAGRFAEPCLITYLGSPYGGYQSTLTAATRRPASSWYSRWYSRCLSCRYELADVSALLLATWQDQLNYSSFGTGPEAVKPASLISTSSVVLTRICTPAQSMSSLNHYLFVRDSQYQLLHTD